jgi:hypothetical protein
MGDKKEPKEQEEQQRPNPFGPRWTEHSEDPDHEKRRK